MTERNLVAKVVVEARRMLDPLSTLRPSEQIAEAILKSSWLSERLARERQEGRAESAGEPVPPTPETEEAL